ncbi:WD40 repeat [Nitrosospira multiformis]|uniref:WD40 repeat n=1 Tax=Nitrosospira multiformis TaxID=1231 RepID=A0A1H8G4G5_9PROT|nr:TIR domain-containing protein [Nitrosospira multiformis]SEN38872.1 WD40 repeat [Nitrosospira multiformis]
MIITFYSYKGGVGRSMALAAVAHLLARRGMRVLAVDFDLEAPGLERYFFDNERSRLKRGELGLMDLLQDYRRALSDEAEFENPAFKRLDRFISPAIVAASSRGGRVDLLTAGQREPVGKIRDYALAVRSFDWQDFFYNWKGDIFFQWLRGQWTESEQGYDVVLVDSRTGVTEMGGVCAYQLADVAVLMCAPNYQNLEGTRDVARDFLSDSVLGLRYGRKLDILAIPARVADNHPMRDKFLAAFERELGSEGLPLALAEIGIGYRNLILPYLPEFAVEEQLVGDDFVNADRTSAVSGAFERLADALVLLANAGDPLYRLRNEALARLRGQVSPEITLLHADVSRATSGFDFFIDYGQSDRDVALFLSRELETRGMKVFIDASLNMGALWSEEIERALDYSAHVLVCFGHSSDSPWRAKLLNFVRRSDKKQIIPIFLPGAQLSALQSYGLDNYVGINFREEIHEDGLREIILLAKRTVAANKLGNGMDINIQCPYPGEHAYLEDDTRFFYGRDEEIGVLIAALEMHPVVLLEGAAKTGKTSLIYGGVLPRLRLGSSSQKSIQLDADTEEFLASPALSFDTAISGKDPAKSRTLVIIDNIDSFTETPISSFALRLKKIQSLLTLTTSSLRVLLVWRGVLHDEEYDSVLQSWQRQGCHRVILEKLEGESLRRAIEQPAREAGHLLENGLTERLIESAGDAKNAVFQIQITLVLLWNERRRGWLTNKSLDALGHLRGVFQRHIDNVLASFNEIDRAAVKVLFKNLTKLDERLELVAQSQVWSEAETIPAIVATDAERLRDLLAMRGLIDIWRKRPQGESAPTSSGIWIALASPNPMHYFGNGDSIPDAYFFMWRSQLATYVVKWRTNQEDRDILLTGNLLTEAEHWFDIRKSEITEIERKFIERSRLHANSIAYLERQKIEEKQRVLEKLAQAKQQVAETELIAAKQREEAAKALAAEQTRATERLLRRKRQLQSAIGVVLVALIYAIYAFFDAKEQQIKAEMAQMQTNGLRLAVESQAIANGLQAGGDERAILQLVAAWRMTPIKEVESGLLTMLISKRDTKKIMAADAPIIAVAFSPDGSRIVSGSVHSTLRLWDAKTGQPIGGLLRGHEAWVESVAFSPDGSRIVSGSVDRTVRLWDAQTGQPIGEPLRGHEAEVESVAFSPDGSRIVSGSEDRTLRLWDAKTGQPIGEPLRGHGGPVFSVAFSPDGSRIVSGSLDGTLRLWDAKTGQPIGEPLRGHEAEVESVAFSPDGSRIVSGSRDRALRLWDAKTGQSIGGPLRGHEAWVESVAFSPDGSRIVSGSRDRTVRLWDAKTGQPIGGPLRAHGGIVTSVAFSPDGSYIVSGNEDKTLRLWEAKTGQPIGEPLRGHEAGVESVAFSPDGSYIVSGNEDKTLRLWDAKTGQPIGGPLRGHGDIVTSVALSPDGSRIVSGSEDRTLRLWDAKTGQSIGGPLRGHEGIVTSVAFSPDGSHIVSGSWDSTLRLWDAQTGQPISEPLRGHMHSVTSVAFSPDGSRIVSGSEDRTLRLWDAQTGQPIGGPLRGHEGIVTSVAFSPDGSHIVSGSWDSTLRLWDAQTGQPISEPLRGHMDSVTSVAFSPDGSHIVSGSEDRTVRLWDAQTGQPIGEPLRGHEAGVESVASSPDGSRIVSGSGDKILRLWPGPKVWPNELCKKLIRNMSREEWRKWISPNIPYEQQCLELMIPAAEV